MESSSQNLNFDNQKFKQFITAQLLRAKLNSRTINKLTTPELMQRWGIAFTHKSISVEANSNYEVVELIGDRFIECIVATYIHKKLGVVNTGFISKIKTNIVQKKGLAKIGLQYGFSEHVKYGSEIEETLDEEKVYDSLIEDTVEAFTGVLVEIIDSVEQVEAGPGYAVAQAWWWSILDEMKLKVDYEIVWDPVSRLKEIFDSRRTSLGWEFNSDVMKRSQTKIVDPQTGKERSRYTIQYFAYLGGDRRAILENKVRIGQGSGMTVDEAKQIAARAALKTLERYGIRDIPKDPFKRTNK